MNYKKLAELANVSVSTVSKAFSGSGDINPQTKEHIFNTAREHGCFDKYYKNKFTKRVIAVLCPEFCSPHYAAYAQGIQKIVNDKNDVAIFSSSNFDILSENYLVDYYALYGKVDGIILIDNRNKTPQKYSIPLVTIGASDTNSVICKCDEGMREAIAYLSQLGHEELCFIGEGLTISTESCFLREAEKMHTTVIRSDKRFEEAGIDCAKRFLELEKRPTAVIAAYDDIAIGFINMLKRYGLSVPKDVSVIGIDNIRRSKHLEIPLTTIDLHINELINDALKVLYKRIEHPTITEKAEIVYTSELVKRKTVTVPRTD